MRRSQVTRLLAMASLGVLAMACATGAAAQCVTIDPVIVPVVRVDPLDSAGPVELVQPFYLTFRRAGVGSGPLSLRYQIVDEDSASFSRVGLSRGPLVEWTTQDTPRDIGALRNEAYALLRTGIVTLSENEPAEQRPVMLRLSELRADLPAGIYREQFTVRFWCAEDEAAPFESIGTVSVSVAVPNVLSASLAGASTRGEVDFMNFEARERSIQVTVRSTGPYRVRATSENGGALLRAGAAAGGSSPADRIPYAATFDGEPLDLSGSGARLAPRAGLLGRSLPLDLRVQDASENRAGAYADTLRVTLEPAN